MQDLQSAHAAASGPPEIARIVKLRHFYYSIRIITSDSNISSVNHEYVLATLMVSRMDNNVWTPRALPTETKVESGTSQSKSGTSLNLSDSGDLQSADAAASGPPEVARIVPEGRDQVLCPARVTPLRRVFQDKWS